jgi:hypothetical protein
MGIFEKSTNDPTLSRVACERFSREESHELPVSVPKLNDTLQQGGALIDTTEGQLPFLTCLFRQ